MGKLNYTTAQVNEAVRKGVSRGYCIVANETDNPDLLVFNSTEATNGTYKLLPLTLV